VKYLFDANALLAIGHVSHTEHTYADAFFARHRTATFYTTPITELAFIRIGANAGYFSRIAAAQSALANLKQSSDGRVQFMPDDIGADVMPAYVTKAKDTTDGHLLALAKKHGAKLATFDSGIPGAELIR
jgi:predicted nucleic acid-binding protein